MPKRNSLKLSPKEEAESVGYLAAFGGFFVAYLIAETALAVRPHPIHWVTAFAGALFIGGAAYGVKLWRMKQHS